MENLNLIDCAHQQNIGMDVIIVSTSTPNQVSFWQKKLEERRGEILKKDTLIIVIEEDWKGGAGNGLGTLYAYIQGRKKILEKHQVDIQELQRKNASIAIYHTAGQGTRLAPLTTSEYNNKSAVKLPGLVGNKECITILEAVLKQTAIYAPSRKGRLSVFWGDQIFISSKTCLYKPTHAIDILVKLNSMPSEKEWHEKGLDKYGLVVIDKNGDAQHIDKADFKTIKNLADRRVIFSEGGIGTSLGSFSLSFEMTEALLDEFSLELMMKSSKMDVEPHIWMATTLGRETYVSLMTKKGVLENLSIFQHERMQKFKEKFLVKNGGTPFFGAVDVGGDCLWWDYGTIETYYASNMKLLENSEEGLIMRRFYKIAPENLIDGSCLINTKIKKGKIVKSVLAGITAEELEVDHCLMIDSSFEKLRAKDCLFYNVEEEETIVVDDKTVRADMYLNDEHIKIKTKSSRDGKEDWNVCLSGNKFSYGELSEMIQVNSINKGI